MTPAILVVDDEADLVGLHLGPAGEITGGAS